MKYSNTALKELSAKYKNILKKCFYLNAIAFMSVAFASNVMATTVTPAEQGKLDIATVEKWSNNTIDTAANAERNGGLLYLTNYNKKSEEISDKTIENNSITTTRNATGSEISTYTQGGVAKLINNSQIAGFDKVNFINNHTISKTDLISSSSNAKTTANGGVLGIWNSGIDHVNGTFKNNSVETQYTGDSEYNGTSDSAGGGAIHAEGQYGKAGEFVGIKTINANFENNHASGAAYANGGAIYYKAGADINAEPASDLVKTTIQGNFIKNYAKAITTNAEAKASTGGAITIKRSNSNQANIDLNGNVFEGNYVSTNKTQAQGGAIFNGKGEGIVNIKNAIFKENYVKSEANTAAGGAIFNEGKMEVVGSNFQGNYADATDMSYGGAIYNQGDLTISDSKFKDNKASEGSAIYNEKGNLTINKSSFDNQSGSYFGGAINMTGGKADIKGSTFTNNTAYHFDNEEDPQDPSNYDGEGGAISIGTTKGSDPHSNANVQISDSTFKNNLANNGGGAIYVYEDSSLALSGTNIFEGNKTDYYENNLKKAKLNDIHNEGSVNVSGNLTLDGGISGNGTTTFANGTNLTVKAGTTTIENTVKNEGANLNIVFNTGYTGGDYLLVDSAKLDNEFKLSNADNGLYTITAKEDAKGSYTIAKKSSSEVAESTGANATQAQAITAVTAKPADNNQSFNAVADEINTKLQSSNKAEVQQALDTITAMAPEAAPAMQATQTQTVTQVFNAVSTRLSGGPAPMARQGASSGDVKFDHAAMWVQGLYNKSTMDAAHGNKGFDAYTRGLALGVESNVTENVKAGMAYAYNKSTIDGFLRDTDIYTHTAVMYGEYKPSNWYVNGMASYGWSDYKEDKQTGSTNTTAKYDAETLAVQVMSGYELPYTSVNVTPEAGIRYIHIDQDKYTDSLGTTISGNKSDIITGVIGTNVSKTVKVAENAYVTPEFNVAVTYDLHTDKGGATVSLANGSGYTVTGEAMDRWGVEVGTGITAELNDNIDLSLNYEGKFRQNYQDHTGLINVKYHF